MDYSTPGSSAHGILQARILEWVDIPFSGDFPYPGIEPGSPALHIYHMVGGGVFLIMLKQSRLLHPCLEALRQDLLP